MKRLTLTISGLALCAAGATAQQADSPAYGDSFNMRDTSVDMSALTTENFYDVLVPLAQESGSLTVYSYWPPAPLVVFQEEIIPAFEEKYGIDVTFASVETAPGLQQMDATSREGEPAPMDVYFTSDLPADLDQMANVRLIDLLPNTQNLNPQFTSVYHGIEHGGAYVPFHANQTVIAWSSAMVDNVPTTYQALLDFSAENPGKVAITSPLRGGSGSNFLKSVAMNLMTDNCIAQQADLRITEEDAASLVDDTDCYAPVWDYFNTLLETAELTNGNTDTLNLMANGIATVGTAWEDLTYSYIQTNQLPDTVRVEILEGGQVGGAEGVLIPSNTENLAGAMLFVNEMLDAKHQAWKLTGFASRSPRTDLDRSLIPEEAQKLLASPDQYPARQLTSVSPVMYAAIREGFVANVLEK